MGTSIMIRKTGEIVATYGFPITMASGDSVEYGEREYRVMYCFLCVEDDVMRIILK